MGSVTHQYGLKSEVYLELVTHLIESFMLIEAFKKAPSYEEEVQFKKLTLQWKTDKQKVIVFDLDETLTHCTLQDS